MNTRICAECGTEFTSEAADFCPRCLLRQGLAASHPGRTTVVGGEEGMSRQAAGAKGPDIPRTLRYVGDYELIEEIARGGMGVVYKARQVSLNRIVAVKVILTGHLASAREVERFHAEAEAAANLQHPNIVCIHEVGEQECHYFSMDYVPGADLQQRLQAGPWEPRQAASLLKKVTEAVAYAHMQGTLHRDLKPSNILIDPRGEPHVTDFGLAKKIGQAGLTMSGTVLGTPAYMAPEQAEGRLEKVDGRSDVYGLGAVLFAMLTGRPPFVGETAVAVMRQVIEQMPPSPARLNPRVPRELEVICLKCLEKNPANRYAGAVELAADLTRFLNGQPILAKPVARVYRFVEYVRQRPWVITGALSLLVLWLMVGAFSFWSFSEFVLEKSAHPGIEPARFAFFEIFGLRGNASLTATSWLFAVLAMLPPVLYAAFASLKQRSKLGFWHLRLFLVLALGQAALGSFALFRGAHWLVWTIRNPGEIPIFALALLPCFWFTSHLLWLVAMEWRGRHFGESPEEVRSLYGVAEPAAKVSKTRADGNGFLCLFCLWLFPTWLAFDTIFDRWMHTLMLGSVLAAVWLARKRRTIREWARSSRVNRQLLGFIGILGLLYLFFFAMAVTEIAAKNLVGLAFSTISIAIIVPLAIWTRRVLREHPAGKALWTESRFSRWLQHARTGQIAYVAALIGMALPVASSVYGVLCVALAVQFSNDLLELCLTRDQLRRRELTLSLILLGGLLAGIYGNEAPIGFGLAVGMALAVGFVCATARHLTLPRPVGLQGRDRAVWAVQASAWAMAGVLWFPQNNLALLNPKDIMQIANARMVLDAFPEWISSELGETMVRGYASAGLHDRGVVELRKIQRRLPAGSPGEFHVRWAMAELTAGAGRTNEAARGLDHLSREFQLVPAVKWRMSQPFLSSGNRSFSTLFPPETDPDSVEWNATPRSSRGLEGHVDLSPALKTDRGNARSQCAVYTRLDFTSPKEQAARLRFGIAGDAKAWLNGVEILRSRHHTAVHLDSDVVSGGLRVGTNTLLVKVCATTDSPGLVLRFTDPRGHPVRDLEF